MGAERRRQKSLRIGVHHANAVVWGPVSHLVHDVRDGVHRLGEHRGRPRDGVRAQLRVGDRRIAKSDDVTSGWGAGARQMEESMAVEKAKSAG